MFESENFDNISEINEVLMEFFFRAFEKQSIFFVFGASINNRNDAQIHLRLLTLCYETK